MSEEAKTVDALAEPEQAVESTPTPHASPNTKAAERKLKEMSRKAKERGKPQKPRSEPVIKLNQSWLLGGLGISAVIAIGYFIYKSRGVINEVPPELQPYHHPPKNVEEEKEPDKSGSVFDLNSF